MGKKTGIVCMILGAVLMGSALLLLFSNERENREAGIQSQQALTQLQQMQPVLSTAPSMEQANTEPQEPVSEETETMGNEELKVTIVNGYAYIGTLKIPTLELELPVQADWSEAGLEISPCRHFGSPQTGDFVIAAHNYVNHFAYLYQLNPGDRVMFTDIGGQTIEYTVDHLERLDPTDVAAVQNSGFPLVLYTCTYGSEGRRAVFCSRTEGTD